MTDGKGTRRKGAFRQVLGAVFWGFFGVRKGRDYQADFERLTPSQIIVAGLVGGVVFILALAAVVWLILHRMQA